MRRALILAATVTLGCAHLDEVEVLDDGEPTGPAVEVVTEEAWMATEPRFLDLAVEVIRAEPPELDPYESCRARVAAARGLVFGAAEASRGSVSESRRDRCVAEHAQLLAAMGAVVERGEEHAWQAACKHARDVVVSARRCR